MGIFFCIIVNILFWIDSTYAMCFNPQKIIDNTHFRAGCFFQGVILYCIFFFQVDLCTSCLYAYKTRLCHGLVFQPVVLEIDGIMNTEKDHQILICHAKLSRKYLTSNSFNMAVIPNTLRRCSKCLPGLKRHN